MANLRDVRLRMKAIRQTLQVTRAMNLISTAKLRKGRRLLSDVEPYFTRIEKSMYDILSGAEIGGNKFLLNPADMVKLTAHPAKKTAEKSEPRSAIIAITSDKGLAGGYNANIFRQVNDLAGKVANPVLILIGEIGHRYFAHTRLVIRESFSFKSKQPDLEGAKEIAEYIISQYLRGIFGEVYIVYTHMYSSIKLLPREQQLLPLDADRMQEEFIRKGQRRVKLQFEYWPSVTEVFDRLVPLYIKGIIFGSLMEAYASEHSARMTAMDEASKNAEDMLSKLQIHYNRIRQAGITQEISEIIGGAAALSN